MGNCLVTKLKANVNNDNLPFLGKLKFDVVQNENSSDEAYRVVYVTASGGDVVLETPAGNYLSRSSDMSNATNKITVTVSDGQVGVYVSPNTDFELFISEYNLKLVQFARVSGSVFKFNLNQVTNIPLLETFIIGDTAIGEVEHMKECKKLINFRIQGSTNVTGDIATVFNAIAPYRENGSTLVYTIENTGVTCNGVPKAGFATVTFDGTGGWTTS